MMPPDSIATLRGFDAILLGAVGWPAEVPDFRLPARPASADPQGLRTVCQYPAAPACSPGVEGPLKARDFDILCIRENTEGEYSGAGGRVHQGTANEVAVETSIFTRAGVERILRFGFEQARTRRGKLASVTKSNAQKYSMVFWDEMHRPASPPTIPMSTVTSYHIDARRRHAW